MLSDTSRIRDFDQTALPTDTGADAAEHATLNAGFGAEYRGLARQRRFERSAVEGPRTTTATASTAATTQPATPATNALRAARGAEQRVPSRTSQPQPAHEPQRTQIHARAQQLAQSESPRAGYLAPRPRGSAMAAATTAAAAEAGQRPTEPRPANGRMQRTSLAAPSRHAAPTIVERLTADPNLMIAELSRMADRVIESRESLALATARIVQLERDNKAFGDRMLAARALVSQAQQTAQSASEQVAFMEGRCDALDQALDLALNASLIQRWKWRRRVNQAVS